MLLNYLPRFWLKIIYNFHIYCHLFYTFLRKTKEKCATDFFVRKLKMRCWNGLRKVFDSFQATYGCRHLFKETLLWSFLFFLFVFVFVLKIDLSSIAFKYWQVVFVTKMTWKVIRDRLQIWLLILSKFKRIS